MISKGKLLFFCKFNLNLASLENSFIICDWPFPLIELKQSLWITYKISFGFGKLFKLVQKKNTQGRRSQRKSAGAKGGTFFWSGFLLHFWAIWKNDPFSKFQKVPGLKPWLPRLVRRPCTEIIFCQINHLFSNFFNKNVAFTTFFVKV